MGKSGIPSNSLMGQEFVRFSAVWRVMRAAMYGCGPDCQLVRSCGSFLNPNCQMVPSKLAGATMKSTCVNCSHQDVSSGNARLLTPIAICLESSNSLASGDVKFFMYTRPAKFARQSILGEKNAVIFSQKLKPWILQALPTRI